MKLRKATIKDMKDLDEIRGEKLPKRHKSRLKQQKEGKAIYFIAFEGKNPVGHVFVVLEGNEKFHNSPILQDLWVKESFRKHKFGTKIIQETEKKLKKLGYDKIGIDVEIKEKWIKSFYEKIGFNVIGKPHKTRWTDKDTNKKVVEFVFHLEKGLRKNNNV